MHLIAIDIGNTTTMLGLFKEQTLVRYWRLSSSRARTPDELFLLLELLLNQANLDIKAIDKLIIASVVPALTDAYSSMKELYFPKPLLIVDEKTYTGLTLEVEEPEALGADRIVNAVGAYHIYGAPTIVVDLGTATTFDVRLLLIWVLRRPLMWYQLKELILEV